ncbi:MAG TPA: helix-hairpin-helix domain-containing protein [Chryseosolibacter sp.]|nr:helix-hairpin-helix domain-containing protein [Chryseosolibacter sp.]
MLLVLLSVGVVNAQESEVRDVDLGTATDNMLDVTDAENINADLYENYYQLVSHPINLNEATADQLRMIGVLTEKQIVALISHIEANGKIISIHELQTIEEFDLNTIHKLKVFVTVDDPQELLNRDFVSRVINHANTYVLTRYEKSLATDGAASDNQNEEFFGTPEKYLLRFRSSIPGDFSAGLTTEKDAGESVRFNQHARQYGFDFYSYHLQLQNKKALKNLILGDYMIQFGQGLTLGNGFGFGKGAETITTIKKSNIGFLPYTSVMESGYLRGIATSIALTPNWSTSFFLSRTGRDANISTEDGQQTISGLLLTGLHRNSDEFADRNTVTEKNFGGAVSYQNDKLEAGLLVHHINFSIPFKKQPSAYNQFSFNGIENTNAGAYFNYRFENVSLFSEFSKTIGGGNGLITGLLASINRDVDVSFVFRKYDKDFTTFYSNAFSENTSPSNETGLYWGWKFKVRPKLYLSGYVDIFVFPWLKFRTYKPSTGREILSRITFQPSRKALLYVQGKQEVKLQNTADENELYSVTPINKYSLLANVDITVNEKLRLKSRFQKSVFTGDQSKTRGAAICQDVIFRSGRFKFTGRYAIFGTDDFDNRQYVYENDVLLAYSLPAYFGTGTRHYIIGEVKISRALSFWLRYSQTKRQTISDDSASVQTETTSDVKMQLMLKL